jgi:glycosyltransferase involved in cell wall biosynthesis
MNRVRIYGICLVKNEDDIIAQTLTFATRHCERIFVLDNGSTDETWNIVKDLARKNSAIVPFLQTTEPFDNGLRAQVYNAVRRELSDNDWWLILDGDEFLAEDPGPVIEVAVRSRADIINTWQIQFYFTERDLQAWEQGQDRRDRPIFERRRHYLINWQESRLFPNNPHRDWDAGVGYRVPNGLTRVCRRRILNRHYQYRDPDQMNKRLRLRHGHRQFTHVRSLDWQAVIRDSRGLNFHRDGDPWRFSPSGLLYFYRRKLHERIRSAAVSRVQAMRGVARE